jgi:2-iminobutanoate/2-iminopropanoate deaminase
LLALPFSACQPGTVTLPKINAMKTVYSDQAPAPVGPYSQAKIHNGVLYCSGQIAINAATGQLVLDTIEEETRLVLRNLEAVLHAGGTDKSRVIKCSVFVTDITLFDRINVIYQDFFGIEDAPARELVQVAKLPKGVNIEISAIAAV